jgi:hypothetical protein
VEEKKKRRREVLTTFGVSIEKRRREEIIHSQIKLGNELKFSRSSS